MAHLISAQTTAPHRPNIVNRVLCDSSIDMCGVRHFYTDSCATHVKRNVYMWKTDLEKRLVYTFISVDMYGVPRPCTDSRVTHIKRDVQKRRMYVEKRPTKRVLFICMSMLTCVAYLSALHRPLRVAKHG